MSCPLCKILNENNSQLLFKGKTCFIMANNNPYKVGHLMVVCNRHIGKLYDLEDEERNELMNLVSKATKLIEDKFKVKGMNVGMNIGENSGASIPEHLHVHLVPRRENDMGFMEVIPSKVINARVYEKTNYLKYFDEFFG